MPGIVPYSTSDSAKYYEDYYTMQGGNGIQVYKGNPMVGTGHARNMFSGLMRSVAPVLKSAGKSLLNREVLTAANVARDVVGGKSIASSAKSRLSEQGKDLLSDLAFATMPDSNKARSRKRKQSTPKRTGKRSRRTIFDRRV